MTTPGTTHAVDAGGPFLLEAPALELGEPRCGHGILVATTFDALSDVAADAITLLLRRAERTEGFSVQAYGKPVTAILSLSTARCAPVDEVAARLMEEHAWLADALAERIDWLRGRARRAEAQRDRETSCRSALRGAADGMIPYDVLFPADWDLVVQHDGAHYWAVDYHCPKPACPCAEITVRFQRLDSPDVRGVGGTRLDLRDPQALPKASTPLAARLFENLWAQHREELVRRHQDVRRHVPAVAPGQVVVAPSPSPGTVGRNVQCPCGSGKKYKRCCLGRDTAPATAGPAPRAQG
jgi:hypothetical protein